MEKFKPEDLIVIVEKLLDLKGKEIPIDERDDLILQLFTMMCPSVLKQRALKEEYENSVPFAFFEIEKFQDHIRNDHNDQPKLCKAFESEGCPIVGHKSMDEHREYARKLCEFFVEKLSKKEEYGN